MIYAIFYEKHDKINQTFEDLRVQAIKSGLKVKGFIHPVVEGDACSMDDMLLFNIETGETTNICLDLGKNAAKSCRLNPTALTEATTALRNSLKSDYDLVLLNKFGRCEAEGGGFCDEIALIVEQEKPLIIGVPLRFKQNFHAFAEGFYEEFSSISQLPQQ